MLAESLGVPVEFAVLKGRSNYICRQRVSEVAGGDQQMELGSDGSASEGERLGPLGREVLRLVGWADSAPSGDRAELPWEPSDVAWAQVSVGSRDCRVRAAAHPDRSASQRRPEKRRWRRTSWWSHPPVRRRLAIDGELLPPHDLVVFDEAHELEDIASAAFGFEIAAGRLHALGRNAKPLLDDSSAAVAVEDSTLLFNAALQPHVGSALSQPLDGDTQERLVLTASG